MSKTVYTMYFSPTHTSRRVAEAIGAAMGQQLGARVLPLDLTRPDAREKEYAFGAEDVLVFAYPVYGGRMPAALDGVMGRIRGGGTPLVPVAVYGNRAFEDALLEASDRLGRQGFITVAGAAFIGEHSFSTTLAGGRPDAADLKKAAAFGGQVAAKLLAGPPQPVALPGDRPYKDAMGAMPFLPKTRESCTRCGLCAAACPMGIIDGEDPALVAAGCIQCCACVKACPVGAKYFDAPQLAQSKARLEENFMDRKEAQCIC